MRTCQQDERNAYSSLSRRLRTSFILVWISLTLGFIAQGCSVYFDRPAPGNEATPFFLPPTRVPPQDVLADTPPTSAAQALPALICVDNLTFVDDLTIPDGSQVQPGATLDKRWEVRNSGTCNWDERYSLRLVAGDRLGVAEQLALYPARSGTNAVIRILFQAPLEPGSYRSAWQAFSPAGEPFGDLIYIDIEVTQ